VTPCFCQNPNLFRLQSYEETPDLSEHRWTLETPEDWKFMKTVFEGFMLRDALSRTKVILNLLRDRLELTMINAHIEQKKL
jgi:spore coat polysaccharide biosynthesis protein SpsF